MMTLPELPPPELSKTMCEARDFAAANGGELIRLPGGFWCKPGASQWAPGSVYFATPTVMALVRRGVAEYTEWQQGRSGKFPIRATLVAAAIRNQPEVET